MAESVILPLDDETDDVVMRLSAEEAKALHLLLSQMSPNEMAAKGLIPEQVAAVCRVIHVCY